jgi:hypothetical protein
MRSITPWSKYDLPDMERDYSLSGKLTPEGHESAKSYIDRVRMESNKPVEGELQKTAEEERFVQLANSYINEELKSIDVEQLSTITPDQVHILSEAAFNSRYPGDILGAKEWLSNAIYIRERIGDRASLYKTILHEMVHRRAYQAFRANTDRRTIRPHRTGYMMQDHNLDLTHLRGFNEAVTDKIVQEILEKNKGGLRDLLQPRDWKDPGFHYQDEYIRVLNNIIRKVSQHNKKEDEEIWLSIKRGHFTGEMMHLRRVEETFGQYALRVLSALGMSSRKTDEQVVQFFETEDPGQRIRLARDILAQQQTP